MTRGAVRCSAWLGARLDSGETWKKSLEALELAGDNRTTGDGKLELSERMALREAKSLAVSRRVENQTPNRGRVCVVAEPRGSNDALGTNVELEARNIANALNLEQTLWRIVLRTGERVRLTTPSSGAAGRKAHSRSTAARGEGAGCARLAERWRRKHSP